MFFLVTSTADPQSLVLAKKPGLGLDCNKVEWRVVGTGVEHVHAR